jgi:hypothetical protein
VLGNAPQRGESQPAQAFDKSIGENSPKAFAGEIGHLVSNEIQMLVSGFVGTAEKAILDKRCRPAGSTGDNGHAVGAEADQKGARGMVEVFDVGGNVALTTYRGHIVLPGGSRRQ